MFKRELVTQLVERLSEPRRFIHGEDGGTGNPSHYATCVP